MASFPKKKLGHLIMHNMGLVAQVFHRAEPEQLGAIGRTRYSTTGSTHWTNAQPIVQHGKARTVHF